MFDIDVGVFNGVGGENRGLLLFDINNRKTDIAGYLLAPVRLGLTGVFGPAVQQVVDLPELAISVKNKDHRRLIGLRIPKIDFATVVAGHGRRLFDNGT